MYKNELDIQYILFFIYLFFIWFYFEMLVISQKHKSG